MRIFHGRPSSSFYVDTSETRGSCEGRDRGYDTWHAWYRPSMLRSLSLVLLVAACGGGASTSPPSPVPTPLPNEPDPTPPVASTQPDAAMVALRADVDMICDAARVTNGKVFMAVGPYIA